LGVGSIAGMADYNKHVSGPSNNDLCHIAPVTGPFFRMGLPLRTSVSAKTGLK